MVVRVINLCVVLGDIDNKYKNSKPWFSLRYSGHEVAAYAKYPEQW